MNDEQLERRLRDWFTAAPSPEEPASLHAFLATVPSAHPQTEQVRRWWARPRVVALAAAVVVLVVASALAVVGSGVLEATRLPSPPPSGAPPSGSPSPIGLATRIGEHAGSSAWLTMTAGGPLVAVSSATLGAAAGGTCLASAIGAIGVGAIDWTAAPAAILELAGDPGGRGAVGLGISGDCRQAVVATPDGAGGFVITPAINPLRPDALFFARKPGDPSTVAAWVTDALKGKGGFLSWSTDGGTSWTSETGARPLGWDATGIFWTIGADGVLAHAQGPGFSSTRTGVVFDVATTPDGQAADVAAATIFRDAVLIASRSGGLESAPTGGSSPPERSLELRVADLSAGDRYVAAVGLDPVTGRPMLGISVDGRTFVLAALPPDFPVGSGDSMRILALEDRVLLTDGGQHGVIGVWSVSVSGLPAAPPSPTPAPTPPIPTPPPAERTSTWTPVTLPALAPSAVGGAGGGFSALPGGGFIDFAPVAADRTIVLRSTDGTSWAEIGALTGSDASGVTGPIAFDGHRYVALGREEGGQFYGPQSNGAAWVSTDLRHWTKAPVQDALAGAEFGGLAAGPDGFVAIGFDDGGQSVWTSPDGLHWNAVTDQRNLPKDSTGPTGIVHTKGGYVMVGRIDQEAATWTSVDGRHWVAHRPLADGSGVVLQGIADGAAGLVSLGSGGPAIEVSPGDFRAPVAPWISSSGATWQAQSPSPALFGAYATVVAAPGGYIAAGTVGLDLAGRIWSSTNGVDWVPVAGVELPGVGSVQLVSDGRHVLLAGSGDNGPVLLVSDGVVGVP